MKAGHKNLAKYKIPSSHISSFRITILRFSSILVKNLIDFCTRKKIEKEVTHRMKIWRYLTNIFTLDFNLSPCSECCMLSSGQFPDFLILYANVSEPNIFPYKYPNILNLSHSSYLPAYKEGTDRVFRNVGIQNPYTGELPRIKHTTRIQALFICKFTVFTYSTCGGQIHLE